MSLPSRDQYLESKVLTASQPKLHVMLLDGALRFGKQAQDQMAAGSAFSEVTEPLSRMFDIVEELLQGLASGEGEVSAQLADQYAFIYRELATCMIKEESGRLDSCLDLLAYQRETWKMASDRVEQESTPEAAPAAGKRPAMLPHMTTAAQVPTAGFSFEA